MLKFREDMYIEQLPMSSYRELIEELNEKCNWTLLAHHIASQLDLESTSWIRNLQEGKNGPFMKTPAEKLLLELNERMCTVGVLAALLKKCQLLNCLSVLSLPEPLTIIQDPTSGLESNVLDIPVGKKLCIECKAVGIPLPGYTWYHENAPLERYESSKLDLSILSTLQGGEYKCMVSQVNTDGEIVDAVWSASVFVNVTATPVEIVEQPVPFMEVKEGDSFTISCKATSHPLPRYQWFWNNTKLEGEISRTLNIEGFNLQDEGKYYCYICNDVSEVYTERSHIMMDLPRQKAVAKVALIIANADYENHERLQTPKNDAAKVARLLEGIGFTVICLLNLKTAQMKRAMEIFCRALTEGTYGLFYFAGHGFKMQESYMLAVDAPKTYLRRDAICESELLSLVLQGEPALLVVILDMCQTVPPRECNPEIHNEVPVVNVYRDEKNLRNLIQAYSTSSYRPSYERINNKYGLYVTHLARYIDKDMPVTKVFEEVGKSIDVLLKGKERNQIPMFAMNVTKAFRLTDATYAGTTSASLSHLHEIITFPTTTRSVLFKQANIMCRVIISPYVEPYLNLLKITVMDLDSLDVSFFNSVRMEVNNLYQIPCKGICWLHNPQINQGPIVISILKDGRPIGAATLSVKECLPKILHDIAT